MHYRFCEAMKSPSYTNARASPAAAEDMTTK